MARDVLFKYRSLDNWKRFLEILLHRRLHAASFRDLNDPMEGRYHYFKDNVTRAFRRSVRHSKDDWKICSLSCEPKNTLMWSYYAGGHTGVALGVTVRPGKGQIVRGVTYDNTVRVGAAHMRRPARQVALEILTQKQLGWQHEREVRVFTPANHVAVRIESVFLGCQMREEDRLFVTQVVRRLAPGAKVHTMHRSELDSPLQEFATR